MNKRRKKEREKKKEGDLNNMSNPKSVGKLVLGPKEAKLLKEEESHHSTTNPNDVILPS